MLCNETYPSKLSEKEIIQAENAMLNLYLQTISVSEGPEFDPALHHCSVSDIKQKITVSRFKHIQIQSRATCS